MQTSFQHTFHFRTNHHTDDSKPQTQGAERKHSLLRKEVKMFCQVICQSIYLSSFAKTLRSTYKVRLCPLLCEKTEK